MRKKEMREALQAAERDAARGRETIDWQSQQTRDLYKRCELLERALVCVLDDDYDGTLFLRDATNRGKFVQAEDTHWHEDDDDGEPVPGKKLTTVFHNRTWTSS